MAPLMLEYYDVPEEKRNEVSKKIKEFYFNGEDVTTANFGSFVKVCTERLFHMGAEKSAKMQANVTAQSVYFMMFGYPVSDQPYRRLYGADIEGVGHGVDGKFIYDYPGMLTTRMTPEEERMKDILLDFLVSFVKTGKPASKGVEWAPVPKDGDLKYLLIKSPDDIQMKTTKGLGAYEFWESLGLNEEERANLQQK